MAGLMTGFLTGFLENQAEKIGDRKEQAQEYFNEQMKLAHERARELRVQYKQKMTSALQVGRQLMSLGVPESTVMAIANQNPDDLPQFYETIQKLQLEGVDTSDPQFYTDLIKVDGEFNAGNENLTSLLQKIYMPLANNVRADPEGFKFDPKGHIWATMLGYNAMDMAQTRLDQTEVIPGYSASDILALDEMGLGQPLGSTPVTLDMGVAGGAARDAQLGTEIERRTALGIGVSDDTLSISERTSLQRAWLDMMETEKIKIGSENPEMMSDPKEIEKLAASRALLNYQDMYGDTPGAMDLPFIREWTMPSENEGEGATAPLLNMEDTPLPEESKGSSEAPIESKKGFPKTLPNGAVFIRMAPEDTSIWRMPSGEEKRIRNSEVMDIVQGQQIMDEAEGINKREIPPSLTPRLQWIK